jgi:hypothetical protein
MDAWRWLLHPPLFALYFSLTESPFDVVRVARH